MKTKTQTRLLIWIIILALAAIALFTSCSTIWDIADTETVLQSGVWVAGEDTIDFYRPGDFKIKIDDKWFYSKQNWYVFEDNIFINGNVYKVDTIVQYNGDIIILTDKETLKRIRR